VARITVAVIPAHRCPARAWLVLVVVVLTLGAGPTSTVRVDNWHAYPVGPLDLAAEWRRYPPRPSAFKQPPAIVQDEDRRVVQLATEGEAMRIGRSLTIDVARTPWLTWEWKALVLPEGGDVRRPRQNDQAGRVMVVFEGMKGIQYIWDTTAPVGTEARPDEFEIFQRVLVVVRSGPREIGQWFRERRNVYEDYRRLFEETPPAVKLVGLESHSNDTRTRTAVRFGGLSFDAR
jgi:Protein of unknown function (DUF3047)